MTIRSSLFLTGKILLAFFISLLLIGMIGLDHLSRHPIVIEKNSWLMDYIPKSLQFNQAILKTEGFYAFPTLELKQFHFKNDMGEVNAPAVHCTWRFRDILMGNIQPMAIRVENPLLHILFDAEDSDTQSLQDKIKDALGKIPIKYLEIQGGNLQLERPEKTPIYLENFTLFVFKHLTKTVGAFQGIVRVEEQSIPLALNLTVSHFNLSMEGSVTVDHLTLKMLPLGEGDTFQSLKEFYPYPMAGKFSFDFSPTTEDFSVDGEWTFQLSPHLKVPLFAKGQWENKEKLLSLNVGSPSLDVALLPKIWYPSAPKVREWILKNISHGHIKNLSVYVEGKFPPQKEMVLKDLKGVMSLEGAKLVYKEGLPPLEQLNCTANFDLNQVKIDVAHAMIQNLKLHQSGALLKDFNKEFMTLDLRLNIAKSLGSLIWFLNHPPLRSVLSNLIPTGSGTVEGSLSLTLPLKENITFSEVQTQGDLQLSNAQMQVNLGQRRLNLTQSNLQLEWTEKGLGVEGTTLIDKFKAQVDIQHNFHPSKEMKTNYQVTGKGNVAPILAFLPPEVALNVKSSGNIELDYKAQETFKGESRTNLKVDFKEAELVLAPLNWRKKAGIKGIVNLSYESYHNTLQKINKMSVHSQNLDIEGKVNFDDEGKMTSFAFSPFKFNNSQGILKGEKGKTGWKIKAHFPYLHGQALVPVIKNYLKNSSASTSSYEVDVDITHLLLAKDIQIKDFKYASQVESGSTKYLTLSAKDLLKVFYGPKDKAMQLSVTLRELKPLLQGLQLTDKIKGNGLTIEATRPLSSPQQPFKGTLVIQDVFIKDAPIFAKILGLISLEGLITQLRGKGLEFKDNEAKFQYKDQQIAIERAKMMSSSIGVTSKGYINLKDKTLALEGVLVPANFLNQMLGNVPIIGRLLSGGKNEGLFSISYSVKGPLGDPKISSNPLGVLAPNFLKSLFHGITHTDTPTPTLEGGPTHTESAN